MFAFVVLDLVHQYYAKSNIGWEERLRNNPILCWVGCKTLTQSVIRLLSAVHVCITKRWTQYQGLHADDPPWSAGWHAQCAAQPCRETARKLSTAALVRSSPWLVQRPSQSAGHLLTSPRSRRQDSMSSLLRRFYQQVNQNVATYLLNVYIHTGWCKNNSGPLDMHIKNCATVILPIISPNANELQKLFYHRT